MACAQLGENLVGHCPRSAEVVESSPYYLVTDPGLIATVASIGAEAGSLSSLLAWPWEIVKESPTCKKLGSPRCGGQPILGKLAFMQVYGRMGAEGLEEKVK